MAVKLKKIAPLSAASLLAFGSLAGAGEEMKAREAKPMSMTGVINPPVRPYVRGGSDLVVKGDALFWKAVSDGLEYASFGSGLAVKLPGITDYDDTYSSTNAIAEAISSCCNTGCGPDGSDLRIPLVITDDEVRNPRHRWDWGFRIGLGVNTAWDNWDVAIDYTHFTNDAKDCVSASDCACEFVVPIYTTPLTQLLFAGVVSAQAKWDLQLNMLDFVLGRDFYVSKYVSMRPFFGIRAARVNQRLDVSYQGGVPSLLNLFVAGVLDTFISDEIDFGLAQQEFKLASKYTGVGPRIGFDTTWRLGAGFSIVANAALNLLYGHFDSTVDIETPYIIQLERELSGGRDATVIDACASFCSEKSDEWRSGKAITDLAIILEWGRNYCADRIRFALRVGYENHLFINQNQFILPFGGIFDQAVFLKNRGDLCAQGWIFGAQLDF